MSLSKKFPLVSRNRPRPEPDVLTKKTDEELRKIAKESGVPLDRLKVIRAGEEPTLMEMVLMTPVGFGRAPKETRV